MAAAFPARPFPSTHDRPQTTGPRTAFNAPQQPTYAGPAYNAPSAPFGGLGAPSGPPGVQQPQSQQQQQQQREALRIERERREAEDQEALGKLSEEQRDEINDAFQLFDINKDGYIDYHELRVALKALGFELSKADISAYLSTHGVPVSSLSAPSGPGKQPQQQQPSYTSTKLVLSLQSFQTIAATLIANRDPHEEILRAFDLFDTDHDGFVSLEDLRRVAKELGEGIQEEELHDMIQEFDMDGDGFITREEFLNICLG